MLAFRWIKSENAQWVAETEYLAEELHRANEIQVSRAA